ncbi:hypothetical protein JCM19045_1501 [Bacillus sp. JCM 19045]|uniref:DUF3918 domain-containing protein n=1 Tax=Shouchella xiaoxiensis TaxID=766895 RepID=A0ABS2SR80_9BACI|nr:hypothetical protein [Shouchella xiaoxiensis]MBM7838024.1 hypothetical protein [Shouchella xiaoxiensis]GAF12327.1 hypothetical protein JCM19045_1501 [Bacillus sp. JCM 19045]
MRKSIAPLMVIGLGAAWYSMNDRKTKKKVHHLFEPIMDAEKKLMNARTWKKTKKKVKKMFH